MIVNHCTVYRKNTGEIVQYSNFTCNDDPEYIRLNFAARVMMFGSDLHDYVATESTPSAQYVVVMDDTAIIADRPELIVRTEGDKTTLLADGTDTIVLTGLPDPCEIIIDDPDPDVETTAQTVNGGGFVFVADDPGVYSIEVRRWPFLPLLIELTAT